MAKSSVVMLAVVAALVVVAMSAGAASAQGCNAGSLAVCAPAIIGGATPTAACCSNLRAQQGCFCQFARNPAYGAYINSPNSRRALASCKIPIPRC